MKNITLAIEDEVLDEARDYAKRHKTTVNSIVREHLARIVADEKRLAEAKRGLRELIDNSTGNLGPDYKWNRAETYEGRMFPRHKRSDLRRDGDGG